MVACFFVGYPRTKKHALLTLRRVSGKLFFEENLK